MKYNPFIPVLIFSLMLTFISCGGGGSAGAGNPGGGSGDPGGDFTNEARIIDVSIVSNNTTNTAYAKTGDRVTVTFTTAGDLSDPEVTFNGEAADNFTLVNDTTYTAEKIVTADTVSPVPFEITYLDDNGDISEPVADTTDATKVIVDNVAPVITEVSIKSTYSAYDRAIPGDSVLVNFTPSEEPADITVSISGRPAENISPFIGASYRAVREIKADEFPGGVIQGNATFEINLKDFAGNTASATVTTDSSSVAYKVVSQARLIVLIDGSGSHGVANFSSVRNFCKQLCLNNFNLSEDGLKVGAIQFGTSTRIEVPFSSDINYVISKFDTMAYMANSTATGDGVLASIAMFEQERQNNPSVNFLPIILLITDGMPNIPAANPNEYFTNAVNQFKAQGGIFLPMHVYQDGGSAIPALKTLLQSLQRSYITDNNFDNKYMQLQYSELNSVIYLLYKDIYKEIFSWYISGGSPGGWLK